MFLYKRKKARWISLINEVVKLTHQPVEYSDEYLSRKIDVHFESEGLPTLAFEPRQ